MLVCAFSPSRRPSRLLAAARMCVGFLLAASVVIPALGAVRDEFPDPRPATRAAAVALVAGDAPTPLGCLTPRIQGLAGSRLGAGPAVRRALVLLQQRSYSGVEETVFAPDGTPVAYTVEPSAFDRIPPTDGDGDGTPDLVQRVVEGLEQARSLLVDQLHLPAPQGLEVVLLELGADLEGYLVARDGGATIVLDGASGADGDAIRNAAAHQYAHAVADAAGPGMPREWSEALATWVTLELNGPPDGIITALISMRLERLDAGLLSHDFSTRPTGSPPSA
jgi:hypothetical protein